jgi:hypothetical protein
MVERRQNGTMTNSEERSSSSLTTLRFPGSFEDDHGAEAITWIVQPSSRRSPPGQSGYEFHTAVRGVRYWGYDLDGLSADDGAYLDGSGVATCVISGEVPCAIEDAGRRRETSIGFSLDIKAVARSNDPHPTYLHLCITYDDRTYDVADEWFENAVPRLERELPEGVSLVCCNTCLFSDYSPGGHGILGMDCHRGAKEQYLAVRSKADYWKVPRTEEVMETHRCPEYERRIPGTGYRG